MDTEDSSSSSFEVDLVTSTSMRLRWQAPSTPFQVDGVRIAVRRNDTKPVTIETRITEQSYVAVNLIPDSEYEFQVIFLHEKNRKLMIIDGTKLVSERVRTAKADYVKAWFFEKIEEIERQWAVYYSQNTQDGVDEEPKISQIQEKCYTGRRCMALAKPAGVQGGCCVDAAPLRSSKKYRAEVYVMLDEDCAGSVVLKACDYEAGHWSSSEVFPSGEGWQKLEVEMIGGPLERVKLSIQCSKDYDGTVLVDACCVYLVGRDKIGEAAHLLERDLESSRPNSDGVLRVALVEAVNLPRYSFSKPPFLPDLATLDDEDDNGSKRKPTSAKSESRGRRRRRSKLRFVARWRGKAVAESAVVAGARNDEDMTDAARPSWLNVEDGQQLACTINLRKSVENDSPSAVSSLLQETLELELQDTTVTGHAAKLKRQKFRAATSTRVSPSLSPSPPKEISALLPSSTETPSSTNEACETLALREISLFGEKSVLDVDDATFLPVGAQALLDRSDSLSARSKLSSLRSASSKRIMMLTGPGASEPIHQVATSKATDEAKSHARCEGAPVAWLQLSIRELLAAPAFRRWYRLENEEGMTQACVALVPRSWNPNGSDVDDIEEDSETVCRLASALAKSAGNSRSRAEQFRELLRLLGVSSTATARQAGSSLRGQNGRLKKILHELKGDSESEDPTEAQGRLDPVVLLERKRQMVRQGLLEECVANLHDPACVEASAALLVALVTFPAKLVKASPDVARCRATLQRVARRTGALAFVEEATDIYSKSLQGAGASNEKTAAVAPLTEKQRTLADAISAAGAPSAPPSVATASAVLAAVCCSRRVLQDVIERRPGVFAVLARGAAEGVASACYSLEMLNLASSFSSKLLSEYKTHRVLVPPDVLAFWRCPSLEGELSDDRDDIRQLCREGRRRERAAERHRQATGTLPRRIRVFARSFARPRSLSGEAAEFARLSHAGGLAFWADDGNRDDLDLVAVAFDELASETLHVKTAEPEPDMRLGTPDTAGSPPLRPPTPEQRHQMALDRQRAVETSLTLAEKNRPSSREGRAYEDDSLLDETGCQDRTQSDIFEDRGDGHLHVIGEENVNEEATLAPANARTNWDYEDGHLEHSGSE